MKLLTALGLSVAILLTGCGGSGTSEDGPNAMALFKEYANTKFEKLLLESGSVESTLSNPQVLFEEHSASEVTVYYKSYFLDGTFVYDIGACTYELRSDTTIVAFDLKTASPFQGEIECPVILIP